MGYGNNILLWAIVSLALVNVSESNPRIDGFGNSSNLIEYQYRYSVDESKTKGPVMDRWEHRIGEYVKGAYSVVEPDGRIRTVDYEVDGGKGYHAVIRMNPPGPGLLSIQQLTKSMELFPEAAIPAQVLAASASSNVPTRNARNDGKLWNYHSKSPYINDIKPDHRASATSQIPRTVPPSAQGNVTIRNENLPLGPANYNVPQTRKLIHFLKPAAFILGKNAAPGSDGKDRKRSAEKWDRIVPSVPPATSSPLTISDKKMDTEQRRIRNSKLVKRFKSMDEIRESIAAL